MKHLFTTMIFCLFWQVSLQAQQFIIGWANSITTPRNSSGVAIATDRDGNSYTVGFADGTVDFDSGPGIDSATFDRAIFIVKQDIYRNFVWVKRYECGHSSITQVVLDSHNNIYIKGNTSCTMDFDPGPDTTLGGYNFLLKLDEIGNFKWVKSWTGGIYSETALTVDAVGNIYMTGFFTGTVDFNPGPGTYSLTAYPSWNWATNLYICKLDSSGDIKWARQLWDINYYVKPVIAVDKTGDIYFAGTFDTYTDFDPGAGAHYITAGSSDGYICKLDNNGNFLDVQVLGGSIPHGINIQGLALDKFDNLYATGYFQGTVDFNPGTAQYSIAGYPLGNNSATMFILKLDKIGNFKWAKKTDGDVVSEQIKIDVTGNVIIAGQASGLCDFDPGSGTYYLPLRGKDAFVSKLDSSGIFISALNFGGKYDDDKILGLSVDSSNGIYLTGVFSDTADMNPGIGHYNLTAEFQPNGFIAQYVTSIFPLHLISFSAKAQNTQVLLQWQTAQEENTSHFIIERSTNGVEYLRIGKVKAAGYSAAQRNYTYIDTSLSSSKVYYYRLKMIDKDGSFTYSKVEKINISRIDKFVVYPNPTQNSIRIFSGKSNMGFQSIKVISSLGRTVKELFNVSSLELSESGVEIDLKDLTPGIYFVQVTDSSGHISTQKVIKQ